MNDSEDKVVVITTYGQMDAFKFKSYLEAAEWLIETHINDNVKILKDNPHLLVSGEDPFSITVNGVKERINAKMDCIKDQSNFLSEKK